MVIKYGRRYRLQSHIAIGIRIAPAGWRVARSITKRWIGVIRFAIDAAGQDPAVGVEPIWNGMAHRDRHAASGRIRIRRRLTATCNDHDGSDGKHHCWEAARRIQAVGPAHVITTQCADTHNGKGQSASHETRSRQGSQGHRRHRASSAEGKNNHGSHRSVCIANDVHICTLAPRRREARV